MYCSEIDIEALEFHIETVTNTHTHTPTQAQLGCLKGGIPSMHIQDEHGIFPIYLLPVEYEQHCQKV